MIFDYGNIDKHTDVNHLYIKNTITMGMLYTVTAKKVRKVVHHCFSRT